MNTFEFPTVITGTYITLHDHEADKAAAVEKATRELLAIHSLTGSEPQNLRDGDPGWSVTYQLVRERLAECKRLRGELADAKRLNADIDRLRVQPAAAEIKCLRREKADLTREVEQCKRQRKADIAELTVRAEVIESLERSRDESQTQLAAKNERITSLMLRCDELREENARLKARFGATPAPLTNAADVEAESPARFGPANPAAESTSDQPLTNAELTSRVRRLERWIAYAYTDLE